MNIAILIISAVFLVICLIYFVGGIITREDIGKLISICSFVGGLGWLAVLVLSIINVALGG